MRNILSLTKSQVTFRYKESKTDQYKTITDRIGNRIPVVGVATCFT